MKNIFIITALLVAVSCVASGEIRLVSAESCEDIKGKESWSGEGHGDSNPSSNKFDEMIFEDDATTCEVAEAIDHMEIKGEIKHHEWDEFEQTFTYMGTSEEVQECFEDRFDLPGNNGKSELQAYEIKDCATGNY